MVFFFNDTATTEIYTLSLHDALPIFDRPPERGHAPLEEYRGQHSHGRRVAPAAQRRCRSEEHTSELQSRQYLVCRLLLEKKTKATPQNKPSNRKEVKKQTKVHAAKET